MMKMDPADGRVLWETPNPGGWAMTHSSVLVLDHPARRQYVYCTTRGVVGVAADNGELLWTKPDWKISIANIPTPVALSPDTVLFTGGYNAGAAVVRIAFENGAFRAVEEDRLEPRLLGSDQQTPLVRDRTVYCVMPSPRGELAVVGPGGVCAWSSGSDRTFGLGPYLMAGSLLYVLSDRAGELFLFEMTETAGRELARAGVLDGHDAWAPMALVGGRLLLRDLTVLKCLEVGESAPPTRQ
jgi:outer membrane protein assembly factor BamB